MERGLEETSTHLPIPDRGNWEKVDEKRVLISMAKSEGEVYDNNARQPLLPPKASYTRFFSDAVDELKSFRLCLRWLCVDHSDAPRAVVSWFLFLLLGLFVSAASHFLFIYSPACRPYDLPGHRRFLFMDKLIAESERVHHGYAFQLNSSVRLLA